MVEKAVVESQMVGGVVTSTVMELVVYPAIFYLWRARPLRREVETPGTTLAQGTP